MTITPLVFCQTDLGNKIQLVIQVRAFSYQCMQKLTAQGKKSISRRPKYNRDNRGNKSTIRKTDLLPGFSEQYNGNSPTTDRSITEKKTTPHKCQDRQPNPLLCETRQSQDEGTKTLPPLCHWNNLIEETPVTQAVQNISVLSHMQINTNHSSFTFVVFKVLKRC